MTSYRDANLEQYEFLTAKDSRTCKLCRQMDGKRFALTEAEVGVNMPPMHPFCRCTVVPVVDSALDGLTDNEIHKEMADRVPEDVEGWLQGKFHRSIIDRNRGMANGLRQSPLWVLTDGRLRPLKKKLGRSERTKS